MPIELLINFDEIEITDCEEEKLKKDGIVWQNADPPIDQSMNRNLKEVSVEICMLIAGISPIPEVIASKCS
jgi:hypothetical protein